jgi:hypothetical protein
MPTVKADLAFIDSLNSKSWDQLTLFIPHLSAGENRCIVITVCKNFHFNGIHGDHMTPTPGFLEQNALISALQLGFALTIFVTLMQIGDKRKIVGITMAIYLVAALLLFLDTYFNVRLLQEYAILSDPAPQEALQRISRAYVAFHLVGTWGLLALVFAIGLTGWIRSVWMGILSTLGAITSLIVIFRFVGILIGSPMFGG